MGCINCFDKFILLIWLPICTAPIAKCEASEHRRAQSIIKQQEARNAEQRLDGCCQTNEPEHQYSFDAHVYQVTKERHSLRAASRFSLNVLRFESDLCELNRLWTEAWIEANFCKLCMRLNRSMALSRRRKGKCEFSTLLFAHRLVTCFSEQPSSLAAAP